MNPDSHPLRPFASCRGDHPARRTCMLMVTHGCNLNCTYCYEKFKNGSKQMDVKLAKEIISKEIELVKRDDRFEELCIDFMGGEPLLRFDLIREVVEWLEAGNCDIPFICFATTNGTLLTTEMKDWFREHKDSIILGASYDGTEGVQGTNRGEAATKVDLSFFHEVWPTQGFRMTISKESLPFLYESYVDAATKGLHIEAALAQGVEWNINDAGIFQKQLSMLSDFYMQNPHCEICNLLSRSLLGIGDIDGYQPRFCGSGVHMITYDFDGSVYGCHMFTPLVLNNRAMKLNDFAGWEDEQRLTDSRCNGCRLMKWCPTCMGFNLKDRHDVCHRDHRWCSMMAVQAICACQFQIQYITNHISQENMQEEDASILHSALNAYEYLQSIDYAASFPQ